MKRVKKLRHCPVKPPNIIEATSAAEVRRVAASATGPVVLDFVAKDCDGCAYQAPQVRGLACEFPETTIVKIDVDRIPKISDEFKVEETPALFVLNGHAVTPPKASAELVEVDEVKRALARHGRR